MKHPFLFALLFAVSAASALPPLYPSGFQITKDKEIIIVINVVKPEEDLKKKQKPKKEEEEDPSIKLNCSPIN